MTASLALYRFGTRLLEPLAPWLVEQRLKRGKENPDRIGERFGVSAVARPRGPSDLDAWRELSANPACCSMCSRPCASAVPNLHALVTTQTTTSADMIAAIGAAERYPPDGAGRRPQGG